MSALLPKQSLGHTVYSLYRYYLFSSDILCCHYRSFFNSIDFAAILKTNVLRLGLEGETTLFWRLLIMECTCDRSTFVDVVGNGNSKSLMVVVVVYCFVGLSAILLLYY